MRYIDGMVKVIVWYVSYSILDRLWYKCSVFLIVLKFVYSESCWYFRVEYVDIGYRVSHE